MWLFLALAATPALAAEPSAAARDLVQASRLDDYLANVANDAATKTHSRGKFSDEELGCIRTFTGSDFSADLAPALAQYLTPAEILEALKFYRSPSGAHLITATFNAIEAKRGGGSFNAELKFTPRQKSDIEAFGATAAGKKLLNQLTVVQSAPVQEVLLSKVSAAMRRCMQPRQAN